MRRLLALFLIACGAPPPPAPGARTLEPGSYVLTYVATRAVGDCSLIGESGFQYHFEVSVDDAGRVGTSVPGVDCSVSYEGIELDASCHGYGSALQLHGQIWANERGTNGTGSLTKVLGCDELEFTFKAVHK